MMESSEDRGYEKNLQSNVSISKNVTACENSFVTKSALYQRDRSMKNIVNRF